MVRFTPPREVTPPLGDEDQSSNILAGSAPVEPEVKLSAQYNIEPEPEPAIKLSSEYPPPQQKKKRRPKQQQQQQVQPNPQPVQNGPPQNGYGQTPSPQSDDRHAGYPNGKEYEDAGGPAAPQGYMQAAGYPQAAPAKQAYAEPVPVMVSTPPQSQSPPPPPPENTVTSCTTLVFKS